jgi:hypothetical protein
VKILNIVKKTQEIMPLLKCDVTFESSYWSNIHILSTPYLLYRSMNNVFHGAVFKGSNIFLSIAYHFQSVAKRFYMWHFMSPLLILANNNFPFDFVWLFRSIRMNRTCSVFLLFFYLKGWAKQWDWIKIGIAKDFITVIFPI